MRTVARVKVLVVEDHPVTRAGIRNVLAGCPRLTVVAEAGTGELALVMARQLRPDVVVADVELPGIDGFDIAECLKTELPGTKVILLSVHQSRERIERATHAGVCGYLLKNEPVETLVKTVLAVAFGDTRGQRGCAATPKAPPATSEKAIKLTERDAQLLRLIAEGKTNKEIASEMGIRKVQVESYRETLRRRVGVSSVAGLTRFAMAHGLVGKAGGSGVL
jgi:two-component system nitrate/nitrite response regulator NarL